MTKSGLTGRGLLQSVEEWDTRNDILGMTLSDHVNSYLLTDTGRGLDIGCQTGVVTDGVAARTALEWCGIEPALNEETRSPGGLSLRPGSASEIPYPEAHFDCILLANVFEHIDPKLYSASLHEMRRVLAPGGIIVGQIPNPHFPIESHSRLPFMGWLPYRAQKAYWRISPAPWKHDFYVVTIRSLTAHAEAAGFEASLIQNFVYPPEVIPHSVRWAAGLLEKPMLRFMPWAWQFVLRPH